MIIVIIIIIRQTSLQVMRVTKYPATAGLGVLRSQRPNTTFANLEAHIEEHYGAGFLTLKCYNISTK